MQPWPSLACPRQRKLDISTSGGRLRFGRRGRHSTSRHRGVYAASRPLTRLLDVGRLARRRMSGMLLDFSTSGESTLRRASGTLLDFTTSGGLPGVVGRYSTCRLPAFSAPVCPSYVYVHVYVYVYVFVCVLFWCCLLFARQEHWNAH